LQPNSHPPYTSLETIFRPGTVSDAPGGLCIIELDISFLLGNCHPPWKTVIFVVEILLLTVCATILYGGNEAVVALEIQDQLEGRDCPIHV